MQVIDLPKNIEVERNILGSLLIDKKSLSLVINYLKEDIFYDYKHQLVFRVIKDMYDKNIQIDLTTVFQRLVDSKQTDQVNAYYLSELTKDVVQLLT